MPNENIKELQEVEQEEIKRILDLPTTLRFPSESDLAHLRKRIGYLTFAEIKQFGLVQAGTGEICNDKTEIVGSVPIFKAKKPQKAKKSPKIAPKKAVKAKKAVKKAKSKRKAR